jgi:hypothetical protein
MLQEIITYIVIAVAVSIAVWKMYKTLSVKKKKPKQHKKTTLSAPHNCSDCIADCSLRDAVPIVRQENEEICETTVVKKKNPRP